MRFSRPLCSAAAFLSRRSHLECIDTHTIYTLHLGPDSVIVDLGANSGLFSKTIRARFDSRCYAVEAARPTFERIEADSKLAKFNVAIMDREGPVRFFVSDNDEASSIFPSIADSFGRRGEIEVEGKTLEAFLQEHGLDEVDILKVDIEGAERQLFTSTSDETLKRMKQITIEFHDFFPNSITTTEVNDIRRRLEGLGFLCLPVGIYYPPMRHADLLFVNRAKVRFPVKDRMLHDAVSMLLNAEGRRTGAAV